jgi:hypothetical protein
VDWVEQCLSYEMKDTIFFFLLELCRWQCLCLCLSLVSSCVSVYLGEGVLCRSGENIKRVHGHRYTHAHPSRSKLLFNARYR